MRGESKAPRSDWPDDPAGQRGRVVEFFRSDLVPHFRAEEDLVFPLAEKHLPGGGQVGLLRGQHRLMEEMVQLLARSEGETLREALAEFGCLLERHIRIEERELFEDLQARAPADDLAECGRGVKRTLSGSEGAGSGGPV